MPKISGGPEKGTRPEGKQTTYKGAYSQDFNEVGKDKCNLMGAGSKQYGYDPAMSAYNPAETAADCRAGMTSPNTQEPVRSWRFPGDTVDVNDGIPPETHIRGGFPSAVSKSTNHPGYRRQPR